MGGPRGDRGVPDPRGPALSPRPNLSQALDEYAIAKARRRRKVTLERVDAVTQDGRVVVLGRALPVTGRVPIVPGETVAVAWEDGRPLVVMMNEGRRGGPPPALAVEIEPVAEELFLPDSGDDRRLWFRNGSQFRPILFEERVGAVDAVSIGGVSVIPEQVFWGGSSADHFAIIGETEIEPVHRVIAVYRLGRPEVGEPFPAGARVRPRLLRLYDLDDAAGPSFGTLTVTNGAGSAANPLRAFSGAGVAGEVISAGPNGNFAAQVTTSAIGRARFAGIAANGDLLLRLTFQGSTSIDGPEAGQSTLVSYSLGTMLVNLTRGTVLAAHAPDRLVPLFVKVVGDPGPPAVFICNAITGGATTSMGHNLDSGARGDAELIGARLVEGVPQVNSYALLEHSDLDASGTFDAHECYPNNGSDYSEAPFRIVGEFAQLIETLPGGTLTTASRVLYQASRTHVLWSRLQNTAYVTPTELRLTDLREQLTAVIGDDPASVLRVPGSNIPEAAQRQMLAVRSGLIYAPLGVAPNQAPHNVQFFVQGGAGPQNPISQTALRRDAALDAVASLRRVTRPAEVAILNAEDNDVQTLNSRSLGAARTGSSL